MVAGISDLKSPALLASGHAPFVGFGMPVGKSKTTARIVIGAGHVKPLRLLHAKGEGGIIDMGDVFIQKNPRHGGTGSGHGGGFAVGQPR